MKVLVIGSVNHYGVSMTRWEDSEFPNVADFELVVVDTTSLTNLLDSYRKSTPVEKENYDKLMRTLIMNMQNVKKGLADLIYSNGKAIAICSPKVAINWRGTPINNYQWLPFSLQLMAEKGDTVEKIDKHFSYYFSVVKKWEFYFHDIIGISDFINNLYSDSNIIKPSMRPIAENRYCKAIGAELCCVIYRRDKYGKEHYINSPASIYCLPPPTQTTIEEAINLILKEEAQIEQITRPPIEVTSIIVPGEADLINDIKIIEGQIKDLKTQAMSLEESLAEKVKVKQLLFEQGPALENICKYTLKQLGNEVDESVEDFVIKQGNRQAIVEVKGRDGVILRKDGSQLATNRRNYVEKKGKGIREVKAILLGNPHRLQFPLETKAKKQQFAPHLVDDAKTEEMALVTTVELFKAYCAFLEGKISSEEVIERLFSGIGKTRLVEE